MAEYRAIDTLCNSDLQLFNRNAGDYIWNKTAPSDSQRAKAASVGTMVHMFLLEGEQAFNDHIVIADVKGRETKRFQELTAANPSNTVLTEDEASQVKAISVSALCNPLFNKMVRADGESEVSIFVNDESTGLDLKIRPDKILTGDIPTLLDVKTTAKLSDWRSDRTWINPLFAHGYGFTASFYLYAASIYYGVELTEYWFAVPQTYIDMGKYPAAVFKITKQELIDYGFWDEMLSALNRFAQAKESGNFEQVEHFPNFATSDFEEITITESE